jgi:DNA polymerase III epsilon subunit-like protein
MRHTVTVVCYAPQHFSTSRKRHDFRKKKQRIEHKMSFDISLSFGWNISHSKKKRARYDKEMYIGLHVVADPLFKSDFIETWIF